MSSSQRQIRTLSNEKHRQTGPALPTKEANAALLSVSQRAIAVRTYLQLRRKSADMASEEANRRTSRVSDGEKSPD